MLRIIDLVCYQNDSFPTSPLSSSYGHLEMQRGIQGRIRTSKKTNLGFLLQQRDRQLRLLHHDLEMYSFSTFPIIMVQKAVLIYILLHDQSNPHREGVLEHLAHVLLEALQLLLPDDARVACESPHSTTSLL